MNYSQVKYAYEFKSLKRFFFEDERGEEFKKER
jgi:hypothetical protein